jgi:hypothetical protein
LRLLYCSAVPRRSGGKEREVAGRAGERAALRQGRCNENLVDESLRRRRRWERWAAVPIDDGSGMEYRLRSGGRKRVRESRVRRVPAPEYFT